MGHQEEGPDKGWSWVIVFAGFLISFILGGIYRAFGVLLVAFINEFHSTREEASWPLVLCISMLNLTGIVAGALGHIFGIRSVCVVGALVAAVGISSCYFATSLAFINVSFGIVFGYFRDNLGSYSKMFYVLGATTLVSCLSWLTEKCLFKAVYNVATDNSNQK